MSYPVGHVPAGDGVCRAAVELRHDAGHLAAALAVVPLHVHVGRRQAAERRSQLVELVGAVISFSDPAAAHAARVVRRATAARPVEIRHRRHVFRRARFAVLHLRPAPLAVFRGLRHPAAARAAFSSPATTTGSISKPCCCACRCSTTRRCERYCRVAWPSCSRSLMRREAGGDGRRQRIGAADRVLQPGADGCAFRRQPARVGAGRRRLDSAAAHRQRLRPVRDHDHEAARNRDRGFV